jgi:hypothetical protein
MLAPEFFDSVDAFLDRARHPVTPRLIGLPEAPPSHHTLDRSHNSKCTDDRHFEAGVDPPEAQFSSE